MENECGSENYSANPETGRPPIPAGLRRRVLVEAGHRCAIPQCRSLAGLDVHHIVPWTSCRKHEYENLIALCPNCHRLAHNGSIDRKALLMYKEKLRSAHDQFSRFEVDLLFNCYRSKGDPIPWPKFLLVLLNRLLELKYLDVQQCSGSIIIGGVDNSPAYLSLSSAGLQYVENMIQKEG